MYTVLTQTVCLTIHFSRLSFPKGVEFSFNDDGHWLNECVYASLNRQLQFVLYINEQAQHN